MKKWIVGGCVLVLATAAVCCFLEWQSKLKHQAEEESMEAWPENADAFMQMFWNRLGTWLADHLPEAQRSLRPGASEQELDAAQNAMGISFPEDLRALYRSHDGQALGYGVPDIFFNRNFAPLKKVVRDYLLWRKIEKSGYGISDPESIPPEHVKSGYTNARWIPFSSDNGNCLGLDMDPGPKGTLGQIIPFGRDEDRKVVIAPSLRDFLRWIIEQVESGNVGVVEYEDEEDGVVSRRTYGVVDLSSAIHVPLFDLYFGIDRN